MVTDRHRVSAALFSFLVITGCMLPPYDEDLLLTLFVLDGRLEKVGETGVVGVLWDSSYEDLAYFPERDAIERGVVLMRGRDHAQVRWISGKKNLMDQGVPPGVARVVMGSSNEEQAQAFLLYYDGGGWWIMPGERNGEGVSWGNPESLSSLFPSAGVVVYGAFASFQGSPSEPLYVALLSGDGAGTYYEHVATGSVWGLSPYDVNLDLRELGSSGISLSRVSGPGVYLFDVFRYESFFLGPGASSLHVWYEEEGALRERDVPVEGVPLEVTPSGYLLTYEESTGEFLVYDSAFSLKDRFSAGRLSPAGWYEWEGKEVFFFSLPHILQTKEGAAAFFEVYAYPLE
ncbi:hypothetical protein [Spirochaeta thermophila]|uniref:Lipoprotein n=1 Tax=Winmispira thermophila (strain ATCC 49972 / DSM 6192 / RI 19.B1) TaxID=665571 RepID=E0RU31_WINT6|nr:hypothetical protein [Spirochaeta thermophila]ADN01087.1 hypothetical protein STHERM_c01110 [Spirochaeta thermophila DSM 6192]